jgi:hypothetical protein
LERRVLSNQGLRKVVIELFNSHFRSSEIHIKLNKINKVYINLQVEISKENPTRSHNDFKKGWSSPSILSLSIVTGPVLWGEPIMLTSDHSL